MIHQKQVFNVPYGATMLVEDGEKILKLKLLFFQWDPYTDIILLERLELLN